MSLYTEDDVREALRSEAADAALPPVATGPAIRRRAARRRAGGRAGALLVAAVLVVIGVDLSLPTAAKRPGRSPVLIQPVSYEQACAVEPDACAGAVTGAIPAALDRRLALPPVGANAACPVTPGAVATNPYVSGLQFGRGQVHMVDGNRGDPGRATIVLGTTQVAGWYAMETVWLSGPEYQGPFLVRGERLDRPGTVGFGGSYPAMAAFVEPPGPDPNTHGPYRTPPGSIWVKGPGCYGFQIDGLSFSETVVIKVLRADGT